MNKTTDKRIVDIVDYLMGKAREIDERKKSDLYYLVGCLARSLQDMDNNVLLSNRLSHALFRLRQYMEKNNLTIKIIE